MLVLPSMLQRSIMGLQSHLTTQGEQYSYRGVLWCSSLAAQPPKELEVLLRATKEAAITIVSLPLVNQWTQVGVP